MGTCSECRYWLCNELIMAKHGEGCGICRMTGDAHFCSHKCPMCEPKEANSNNV